MSKSKIIQNNYLKHTYMAINKTTEKIIRDFNKVKRITKKLLSRLNYSNKEEYYEKEYNRIGYRKIQLMRDEINLGKRLKFKKFENQYKSYEGYKSFNTKTKIIWTGK